MTIDQSDNINYNQLLNYAFKLLGQRRYTEKKLIKKLKAKDKNTCDIPKVVSRLNELNYLDDLDYAMAYIRNLKQSTPCGKYLMSQKLKQQGIDNINIYKAIEASEIDENSLAEKALEKKERSFKSLSKEKRKQKALNFLKSRGFCIEVIYSKINSI